MRCARVFNQLNSSLGGRLYELIDNLVKVWRRHVFSRFRCKSWDVKGRSHKQNGVVGVHVPIATSTTAQASWGHNQNTTGLLPVHTAQVHIYIYTFVQLSERAIPTIHPYVSTIAYTVVDTKHEHTHRQQKKKRSLCLHPKSFFDALPEYTGIRVLKRHPLHRKPSPCSCPLPPPPPHSGLIPIPIPTPIPTLKTLLGGWTSGACRRGRPRR